METIETFRADGAGSNPVLDFFFEIQIILKWPKKDDAMRLNLIIQAFFYDPENSNFIVSNGNFLSTSIKIQGPRSFRELLSWDLYVDITYMI